MMIKKSEWETLKPSIHDKFSEVFNKLNEKQKSKFIGLWEKLDPVDEIYYQYCQNEENRYQYYIERYLANKKFCEKIQEVFENSIYDVDASSMLEMWRILSCERSEENFLKKAANKFERHQKEKIQKKLQKHAKTGHIISSEKVENYLVLLVGQKKRQKQIIEAESHVPAELLIYFDEHGDEILTQQNRYFVLEYCLNCLSSFGFEKKEEKFLDLLMRKMVISFPKEALQDLKEFMYAINRGDIV